MHISKTIQRELHRRWKGPPSPYREVIRRVLPTIKEHLEVAGLIAREQLDVRISSRIKPPKRTLEKAHRPGYLQQVNSIDDLETIITDIAGIRVVVDYLKHANEILKFIRSRPEWTVAKVDSHIRETGYRALHVDLIAGTTHFPQGVRCEVQIMTLLQNAWAIWSHPLYERYRRDLSKVPKKKREVMRQLSDMLHVVDEMAQTL